jgi:hypothetical protein
MTKRFWVCLVLPLVFLAGIFLLVNKFYPAGGLFINLFTETVGILITVCFVNWMLKQHEKHGWLAVDVRIGNRLRILLNSVVAGIKDGLGFSPAILDKRFLLSQNMIEMHNEIIRISEQVISPAVFQRIQALDSNGWKSLATHLKNSHNGTLVFLNAFQSRLGPDQISTLWDLQESLSNSLTFYTVFHDMAGVPENQLPQMPTPPQILMQSGYEQTAKEIQKVLALAKNLSQSISRGG